MKKRTKLFKIGEYANYGNWRATLDGSTVKLEGIDRNTNAVVDRRDFNTQSLNDIQNYLVDNMSSYHADKIIEWVKQ